MAVLDRVRRMWNAFKSTEDFDRYNTFGSSGLGSSVRPDRTRLRYTNERSIISSIFTRISIDVAAIDIRHVKLDENGRYEADADSDLNECLLIEPNLDQGPRAFKQDIVMTLFDKGSAAIVPIDTSIDPDLGKPFDVSTLRVGEIVNWYPRHVRVSAYNIERGVREEITLAKRSVAIVENPLFPVMNEPNSTLQRLVRKLNLLDAVDEQSGSGKLDLIIQLPYVVKSESRKVQAAQRRDDIALQLRGSQYGIAYTDGTEKITQLNRPAENNLLKQVEYLINMLYGQLGLTEEVMNGTADEKAMLNYFNRTIEPIIVAIIEAMQRSLLRWVDSKGSERIQYFNNPFKLVPIAQLAEIADKLSRNEVLSANEIRGYIGLTPSKDPKADQLINSNMPQPIDAAATPAAPAGPTMEDMDGVMDDVFNSLEADLDKIGE